MESPYPRSAIVHVRSEARASFVVIAKASRRLSAAGYSGTFEEDSLALSRTILLLSSKMVWYIRGGDRV